MTTLPRSPVPSTPTRSARCSRELTERVRRAIPSPPESVEERAELDESLRSADASIREHLNAADPGEVEKLEAMLKARRGGRDAA